MSRISHRAQRLAGASVLAVAALSAAGAPAQAADATYSYACTYPLIGTQPLKIAINASIPQNWSAGQKTDAFAIKAVATPGGDTANGLGLVLAKSLEGSASASAVISAPGLVSGGLKLKVPIAIEKYTVPASGALVLNATGSTPPILFNQPGVAQINLGDLRLNLTARDASGAAIQLPPIGTDSDGDPNTFDVNCSLNPTSQSSLLSTLSITDGTEAPDTAAPSTPGGVAASATGSSSASLRWSPSTDNVGVIAYEIYQNGALVQSVLGTSTSTAIGGLAAGTTYGFTVKARDAAGNLSPLSGRSSITTPADTSAASTVDYKYSLTGTSVLKTLTQGPINVSGSIGAKINLRTQAFTGDVKLNNTRANLKLAGFVPVTAQVGFVAAGPTTGTLKNGVLRAQTKQTIRLPQLYLFGSVPVAGAGGCRTKVPTTIALQSRSSQFQPLKGGEIFGAYTIGELVDCGALTGIISPLAQGSGNTISVNLTPAN